MYSTPWQEVCNLYSNPLITTKVLSLAATKLVNKHAKFHIASVTRHETRKGVKLLLKQPSY